MITSQLSWNKNLWVWLQCDYTVFAIEYNRLQIYNYSKSGLDVPIENNQFENKTE